MIVFLSIAKMIDDFQRLNEGCVILNAKKFSANNFGGKIFSGKYFGKVSTISVINFCGICKNFGGSRKFQYCQRKQKIELIYSSRKRTKWEHF